MAGFKQDFCLLFEALLIQLQYKYIADPREWLKKSIYNLQSVQCLSRAITKNKAWYQSVLDFWLDLGPVDVTVGHISLKAV